MVKPSIFCLITRLGHYNSKNLKFNISASLFKKNRLRFKADLVVKMVLGICFFYTFCYIFLFIDSHNNELADFFLEALTKSIGSLFILLILFCIPILRPILIFALVPVPTTFTNNKLIKKIIEIYLAVQVKPLALALVLI